MNKYINDWHTIIDFGIHKGKKLMDVPEKYLDWICNNIKKGVIHEAITRIHNRKGVTTLIKKQPIYDYIPEMKEDTNHVLPIINRPNDIDCSLFGSFVEYYIKYNLGIAKFDEVTEYLALYGLAKIPNDLKMTGEIMKPSTRTLYISKSYYKEKYDILDICNMSFTHSLQMETFNEHEGAKLYKYIQQNKQYFDDFCEVLKYFPNIPKFTQQEQEKCDKISVGCVIGIIDVISDTNIIDIKCCINDNISYYRKQLFTYACLYYLRYGKLMTHCKIFNFMNGKIYIMDISSITDDIAINHIKNMGSHCSYHTKLFEQ